MLEILIVTVFLSPYILVPFFMARWFRKRAIEPQWLTYLLTAVMLLIYPDLLFWISSLSKAPSEEGRSICMFPPILMNVPLLPIAMLFQWGFNRRHSVKLRS